MDDLQGSGCTVMVREIKRRIYDVFVASYVSVPQRRMIHTQLNDELDDSARDGDTSPAVSGGEEIA